MNFKNQNLLQSFNSKRKRRENKYPVFWDFRWDFPQLFESKKFTSSPHISHSPSSPFRFVSMKQRGTHIRTFIRTVTRSVSSGAGKQTHDSLCLPPLPPSAHNVKIIHWRYTNGVSPMYYELCKSRIWILINRSGAVEGVEEGEGISTQ